MQSWRWKMFLKSSEKKKLMFALFFKTSAILSPPRRDLKDSPSWVPQQLPIATGIKHRLQVTSMLLRSFEPRQDMGESLTLSCPGGAAEGNVQSSHSGDLHRFRLACSFCCIDLLCDFQIWYWGCVPGPSQASIPHWVAECYKAEDETKCPPVGWENVEPLPSL